MTQSFLFISVERAIFPDVKQSMMITEINNLYIPATEVGVSESLIMIEEIETDKILINNRINGCNSIGGLFELAIVPPKCVTIPVHRIV